MLCPPSPPGPPARRPSSRTNAGTRGLPRARYLPLLLLLALCGCGQVPAATVLPSVRNPRAAARQASKVVVPYRDPQGTFTLRRPQTWIVVDARSAGRFAASLGDGVRFFEPITAADPDAGSSGKLWIDVLPARRATPRQVLLQPFLAADYPPTLLARLRLAPFHLGGVPGYRLVTLAGRTQVTLLLVPWRGRFYRLTVFSAGIPAEVAPVLASWRFVPPVRHPVPGAVRAGTAMRLYPALRRRADGQALLAAAPGARPPGPAHVLGVAPPPLPGPNGAGR